MARDSRFAAVPAVRADENSSAYGVGLVSAAAGIAAFRQTRIFFAIDHFIARVSDSRAT